MSNKRQNLRIVTFNILFRLGVFVLILTLGYLASPLKANDLPENKATLNFVDADIRVVVRAIGKFTGRTFIFDPRIKGKLNLVSESSITRKEAYKLLAISLKLRGYALMEAEGYIMVVPEADGKRHATFDREENAHTGQIVTKIYSLENETAFQSL